MSEGERRLAAIMFTDMVGFTSLTQSNETLAMEVLERHKRILRPFFTKFRGREVKTIGDSFLVEFDSALDAVRCALEIQSHLHDFNVASKDEWRIKLRTGIHLGDVIHQDGDVLGDAVNVASRIEPLAEPEGICISEQVFDQVRNKFERPLLKLPSKDLKNVQVSLEVYKVEMPWDKPVQSEDVIPSSGNRIAILPFANYSPDPNDEFFADGITEEIISTVSGISGLSVISRTSIMGYKGTRKRVKEIGRELEVGSVLEGSFRKAGNRIRVTTQLIDVTGDRHLWAQTYDRQLDDVFAVQSEIAEKVAEKLKVRIQESERRTIERVPTESVEAYALYLKGRYHWNKRSKEEMEKAIEYFQLAVEHDPKFALGYSGLADCYNVMARNGLAEPGIAYPKGKEYATKALELDEKLGEPHAALGSISLYYDHDYDKAESEFRRAIELKPSYSTAHQWYFHLLATEGRFHDALEQTSRAVELDPISPAINANHGDAFYWLDQYDRTIEQYKKVIEFGPKWDWPWLSLAFTYAEMSAFDEALKAVERYDELSDRPLDSKLVRAHVYASMGRKEECKLLLDEVKKRFREELLSPYVIGTVHFLLGQVDEGFEWLERAYGDRDPWLVWIGVDKDLRGVRSDPRYLSLLDRIGLSKHLSRA